MYESNLASSQSPSAPTPALQHMQKRLAELNSLTEEKIGYIKSRCNDILNLRSEESDKPTALSKEVAIVDLQGSMDKELRRVEDNLANLTKIHDHLCRII